MRHPLLGSATPTYPNGTAQTHFGKAIKKFLAAAIGLHAVVLVIAPDGVAGTLVSAQNQATGALCIGSFPCTLMPAPVVAPPPPTGPPNSPTGFFEQRVEVFGATSGTVVHSYGGPLPTGMVVGDSVSFSPDFGSRSSGTNSFLVNGSYQTRFEIEGFTNPLIEFHFQPGEVTASRQSNAGFETASLDIHLRSTDEFFTPGPEILGFPKSIAVSVVQSDPIVANNGVPFLKATQSGCVNDPVTGALATSCSFTFDSLTTDAQPLGGNGFFLFELDTFAAGSVVGSTVSSGSSVARSGDPNGPAGEFGFTIFEGVAQVPEPSSLMLVLIGLALLGFPLLKLNRGDLV